MSLTTQQVADFFLAAQDPEDHIDHLKIQKLCYYAQGMYVAVFGRPLFDEALMAWKHGPVVQSLWRKYRYSNSSPLTPSPDFDIQSVPADVAAFLRRVYTEYGQYSPWRLRDMTHAEVPWREAKESGRSTLDVETMRQFFRQQLELRLAERPQLTSDQLREFAQNDPSVKDMVAKSRIDFEMGRFSRT